MPVRVLLQNIIRARGGEAQRAETAARHPGRSQPMWRKKWGPPQFLIWGGVGDSCKGPPILYPHGLGHARMTCGIFGSLRLAAARPNPSPLHALMEAQ